MIIITNKTIGMSIGALTKGLYSPKLCLYANTAIKKNIKSKIKVSGRNGNKNTAAIRPSFMSYNIRATPITPTIPAAKYLIGK